MLRLDASGRILDANTVLCSLLQCSLQELKQQSLWELGGASAPEANRHAVDSLHSKGYLRKTDLPLKSKDGARNFFEFHRLGRLVGDAELIECRFQAREVVSPTAADNPPTREGLGERLLRHPQFEEIANQEIERARKNGQPLSLLSVGIDRIRNGGPAPASQSLHGVVEACAALLRATDIVGKVDDHVFIALLPGLTSNAALCAAERLRTVIAALEMPAPTQGRSRRVTVSIGVVTTRAGSTSYGALRSRADAKRDDAKNRGGNRVNG